MALSESLKNSGYMNKLKCSVELLCGHTHDHIGGHSHTYEFTRRQEVYSMATLRVLF